MIKVWLIHLFWPRLRIRIRACREDGSGLHIQTQNPSRVIVLSNFHSLFNGWSDNILLYWRKKAEFYEIGSGSCCLYDRIRFIFFKGWIWTRVNSTRIGSAPLSITIKTWRKLRFKLTSGSPLSAWIINLLLLDLRILPCESPPIW